MAAAKFTIWQALEAAIRLAVRANEEARLLARALPDAKAARDAMSAEVSAAVANALDDMRPVIAEEVRAAAAALAEVTGENIKQQIAAIPKPRDGAGYKNVFVGGAGELIFVKDDGETEIVAPGFAKDITADALREMVSEAAADLHQGLWEPKSYRKGMWVTYGGSIFAAQDDADPTQRPLASEAWKMILQRGRDGKDAVVPKQPRPPMTLPPKDSE